MALRVLDLSIDRTLDVSVVDRSNDRPTIHPVMSASDRQSSLTETENKDRAECDDIYREILAKSQYVPFESYLNPFSGARSRPQKIKQITKIEKKTYPLRKSLVILGIFGLGTWFFVILVKLLIFGTNLELQKMD